MAVKPSVNQPPTWPSLRVTRRGPIVVLSTLALVVLVALIYTNGTTVRSRNHTLTVDNNGQTVELRPRDTLTIELPGSLSFGNRWRVASIDDDVLRLTHVDDGEYDWGTDYDRGFTTLRFKAISTGRTTLLLHYARPTDTTVERTFSVTVVVEKSLF